MKAMQKGFTLIELMIVVAIIGILAAVAIPAYGDYTARAQASEAFTMLDAFKTPLTEQINNGGTFLIEGNPGVAVGSGVQGITSGKYVASVRTTSVTNGAADRTSIEATYQATGVSKKLLNTAGTGAMVHMYYNPVGGTWTCANGDASADATLAAVVAAKVGTEKAVIGPAATQLAVAILPKSCQ